MEVMDNMFSDMSQEDRIQFALTMMPKCLNMIFSELEPDAKERLAKEMTNKMIAIFEEQLTQTEINKT